MAFFTILVGVPKYSSDSIEDLPFCANDIKSFQNVLINRQGVSATTMIVLGDKSDAVVNKTEILRNIRYASENAPIESTILFYFSGHGFSSDGKAYIAPSDTEFDLADDTAISIERIRKEFSASKAKTKLFFIDSCFSGIIPGKSSNSMTKEFENALDELKSEGWIIFASCKGDEVSHSLSDGSLSVFTFYLTEALHGKALEQSRGNLSFSELTRYVTKNVTKWALDNRTSQTPNFKAEMIGEVIFPVNNPIEEKEKESPEVKPVNYKMILQLILSKEYEAPYQSITSGVGAINVPLLGNFGVATLSDDTRKKTKSASFNGITSSVFTTLIRYIKPSEIKKERHLFAFPFGDFEIASDDVYSYRVNLYIKYDKISDIVVKSFLRNLDSQKQDK